eukprot:5923028-Alexandrium_andersonii.AAC.1
MNDAHSSSRAWQRSPSLFRHLQGRLSVLHSCTATATRLPLVAACKACTLVVRARRQHPQGAKDYRAKHVL